MWHAHLPNLPLNCSTSTYYVSDRFGRGPVKHTSQILDTHVVHSQKSPSDTWPESSNFGKESSHFGKERSDVFGLAVRRILHASNLL